MFTKKGEATLTVLILGVLAVSLISTFSNSYTGYQTAGSSDFICSDTDSENSVFILGTITGRNETGEYTFQDECGWNLRFNSTYVYETKCVNNQPASEQILCPSPKGVCNNGLCVDDIVTPTCTDTDGNNLFTKGSVIGQNYSGSYNLTDSCSYPGSPFILERTCLADNQPSTDEQRCSNGCANGACINPDPRTCTDTDPNNDVYIKGSVYGQYLSGRRTITFSYTDGCYRSRRVREGICKPGGKPSYLTKQCPNNKKCIRAKGICQK